MLIKEKTKIKNFTDLIAWQKGHLIVLEIYKLTGHFPTQEMYGLTSQIRRAAISITSNLAEGFGRKSKKEKVHFYQISIGSLTEIQNQLFVAKDLGYISEKQFQQIFEETISASKLINALIASIISSATRCQLLATFILTGIFFLFSANHNNVSAQTTTSFGVDPLKMEFELTEESSVTKEIKVYNLTNTEASYQVSAEKFNLIGEQGGLQIEKKTGKEIQISFDKDYLIIPANASETINATFQGKKNIETKEYLYMVTITPESSSVTSGNAQTNVLGKIGILTFINYQSSGEVLGEFSKSGRIVEFSVDRNWNFISPAYFTARVNSTGNTHFNAYGTVQIKNNKGEIIKTIALEKATILAGSTRILNENGKDELSWDFQTHIGKYQAVLEVKSEDGEISLTKEITFYTIPLIVIIPVIIILVSSGILIKIFYGKVLGKRHSKNKTS